MTKEKISGAFKALILTSILAAGIWECVTMDGRVAETLTEVETVRMSRVSFRPSVAIRGSLYTEGGEWYAAVSVDESEIAAVTVGQPAELSGAAFGETLSGSVAAIADTAQSEGGRTTIPVTIRLDGESAALRSGYTVRGNIFSDEARLLHTLPYAAIRQDDDGEYVYLYVGNRAIRRSIETGIELSGEAEILAGLSEQSEVILSPDSVIDQEIVRREGAE
ncbi:MAG: efflux RND transporter periplasmic adaptor subunit [Bacteroides sp.]|nr:efflux RND transporter periplasmic adaptor subunit [Eubacterium sp.]MCM1418808.1 efflux RND transporter periplasmic adaptor subunit [Roseburia sp.]MCM1462081.1 efflux RND transporter periplasmic adaptor subunit [Bacteroides sp.]